MSFKVHGKWCGPGYSGGVYDPRTPLSELPFDAEDILDEACRDHDFAVEAEDPEADQKFYKATQKIASPDTFLENGFDPIRRWKAAAFGPAVLYGTGPYNHIMGRNRRKIALDDGGVTKAPGPETIVDVQSNRQTVSHAPAFTGWCYKQFATNSSGTSIGTGNSTTIQSVGTWSSSVSSTAKDSFTASAGTDSLANVMDVFGVYQGCLIRVSGAIPLVYQTGTPGSNPYIQIYVCTNTSNGSSSNQLAGASVVLPWLSGSSSSIQSYQFNFTIPLFAGYQGLGVYFRNQTGATITTAPNSLTVPMLLDYEWISPIGNGGLSSRWVGA